MWYTLNLKVNSQLNKGLQQKSKECGNKFSKMERFVFQTMLSKRVNIWVPNDMVLEHNI